MLWRWHQLIVDHTDDLAAILTAEMGKPFSEAKSEVTHAAAYLQWYAEEANRIYGETIGSVANFRPAIETAGRRQPSRGSDDFKLLGDGRIRIVGVPRLSFSHHVDHFDAAERGDRACE